MMEALFESAKINRAIKKLRNSKNLWIKEYVDRYEKMQENR